MLRFKALVVMCLGLLAACGPTESKVRASEDSPGKLTSALARPRVEDSSAAAGEVNPSSLSFGEQRVGTVSAPLLVTVSNAGSSPLTITHAAISGPFTLVSAQAMPFTLAPGMSQALPVDFRPVVEGAVTGTLTLATDEPGRPSIDVALFGSGVRPVIALFPSALDFGEQRVDTSSTKLVMVKNVGTGTLRISGVSLTGGAPFSVSPNAPFDLPAGEIRELAVTFSPTVEGAVTSTLTLSTNDPGNPTATVPLSGSGVTGAVPQAQLSLPGDFTPISTLDFGGVQVNASTQRMVRLTNTGSAPLTITEPPVVSSPAFAYVGPASQTIPPNAFVDFQVSFSPASTGVYNATLTLKSNAANSPTVLNLSGFGASPELRLDRGSLSFGDVRVGSQSAPLFVTVSNTGSAEALLQALVVEGPFAAVLPAGVALPWTIAARTTFTFEVIFKPSAQGMAAGSITLQADPSGSAPLKVALSGNGTVAQLATSVSTLDFGSQRVAQTSGAQPLILTNTGTAELMITQLVFSHSVFAISSPQPLPTEASPMRIAPGEQKVLGLTFTPKELGLVEGKLHIISNASTPASPVALAGKGVDGQLGLTPAVLSFSSVDVGTTGTQQSVVLSNMGSSPVTLTKVTPPAEPSFTLSGLTPGLVLNPGEQRTFTVTFSPTRRGYVSTSAILHSDAGINSELHLAISGTGVAPAVELLPRELLFGKSNVGATTLQDLAIKNVGERDLYVSNLSFVDVTAGAAQDFSVGGAAVFPLRVKPGESSLVQVEFSPREVGLREARALVYTNDRTAEVKLLGEATSPNLELSPLALDFGIVPVGRTSSPRVLKLGNTGSGPLTLFSLVLGGADAGAFTLTTPSLPITLPPGASTEVFVSLHPDAGRQFAAQLRVGSSDPDAPSLSVPLAGLGVTGTGHGVTFSPSPLQFGQQLIRHTSSPRKVRAINTSDTRMTLTGLSVTGAGASQFSLAPLTLPIALEPGQTLEVSATFTPQGTTDTDCALEFTFDGLPYEVALLGKGTTAVLSVNPSPLDFGAVRYGGGKRERPFTLTNLSSETITLAAPEVTYQTGEAFTFDAASLKGRTLEPGKSVIVTVGYQPMVETLSETTLSFGTTTPDEPRAVELEVKGRATKYLLFSDPDSLNFGRVDLSAPELRKEVTLINRSSQPQWAVVKLKNPEGSPFSVVESTALAQPIPPGGRVSFKVSFLPQVQGEDHNEVQVFLQGETEPDVVILVSGTGYGGSTESSGGCSCGSTEAGSSGMLMLLALMVLGARRRLG